MHNAANLNTRTHRSPNFALGRMAVIVLAVLLTALIGAVALVAMMSAFGVIRLPFEMALVAERMPVLFPLHMATSAAALVLLPVAVALRHKREPHRMVGWLLGVFVLAGGLSALPVALFSHSSVASRLGFAVQGVVWLGLLIGGILAIRAGQRQRHVLMMVAMAVVTTGAVWFRLTIGTAIWLRLPFEATYAIAAWTSWLLPLAAVIVGRERIVSALIRPPRAPATRPSTAMAAPLPS